MVPYERSVHMVAYDPAAIRRQGHLNIDFLQATIDSRG